eukprot:TRINITY_DN19379_c0_g3_i2.p1 TRINITY_DN19379_c0_g3~~TRINITY_DN19379_c0_g3_i2.p1  ORF type:complete len:353 (+),score=69.35 TRINITY_DN19379_c0_g3_i2:74-1132(+)
MGGACSKRNSEPCRLGGLDHQHFAASSTSHRCEFAGPLILEGVVLNSETNINTILSQLGETFKDQESLLHVRKSLELARTLNRDVRDRSFMNDCQKGLLWDSLAARISQISITKAGIITESLLEKFSSKQVYHLINGIAPGHFFFNEGPYQRYAQECLKHGIDGKFLATFTDEMLHEYLKIDNALHLQRIRCELESLKLAQAVQTFDLKIAIGTYTSTQQGFGKKDIEDLFVEDLKKACLQNGYKADVFSPSQGSAVTGSAVAAAALNDDDHHAPADANADADADAHPSVKRDTISFQQGQKVTYFRTKTSEPIEAIVAEVNEENGSAKIEYYDGKSKESCKVRFDRLQAAH